VLGAQSLFLSGRLCWKEVKDPDLHVKMGWLKKAPLFSNVEKCV